MIVFVILIIVVSLIHFIINKLDIHIDTDIEDPSIEYLWYTPIFGKRTVRKYIKFKKNVH